LVTQPCHFVESGFAFEGLTIDIDGAKPFHVAYEFPLYQPIVGVLFAAFGFAFIWGKLVSFAAALITILEIPARIVFACSAFQRRSGGRTWHHGTTCHLLVAVHPRFELRGEEA
jgi:hypothetical protein